MPVIPPSIWNAQSRLALGHEWPPRSEAEVMKLIEQMTIDYLLPLFAVSAPRNDVVDAVLARSRAMQRVFEHRARRFAAAAAHVAEVLEGEPFVFAKGLDYAYRLYDDPALRPMQDMDVLVPRERFAAVDKRFREAGFTHQPVGGVAGRTQSFHETGYAVDNDVFLDLHQSFVQRGRYAVNYEAIFRDAVPFETRDFRGKRLSDLHALAYHVINIAKDELSVPLIRYIDLWLMLERDRELLPRLVDLAPRWQMRRALYATLKVLTMVIPEANVGDAMTAVLPASTRAFIDARALPDPFRERGAFHDRGRTVQLWRKAVLLDNWWRRLHFVAEHGWHYVKGLAAGPNAYDEHMRRGSA